MFGNGKPVEFARKLEEESKGTTMKLYREAQKIMKNFPYLEMIDLYKEKLEQFSRFLDSK